MEIIKVGYINSEGKTNGCETAPNLVIESLKEIHSNEKGKIIDVKSLNLEEIHVDLNNPEDSEYLIFENSKEIFEKNGKALFIGGDHSISYSIIRGFSKVQEKPLLIVFDSHLDSICDDTSKCAKSRSWIRKLVESGFNPRDLVIISARNISEEELKFLNENKITWIKMDILEEDLSGVCDIVMERARNSGGFYISVDIDSVDPAFAPGTTDLEPGGLSSRDLIYFIKRLALLDNFRGGDIVNINPNKDINGMTVKLGAKILGEMI